MDHIFPLKLLEVIGCKEVPILSPAMPRLLSPIFAICDSDKVLFPPYTLGDEEVIRPVLSNRAEFDDLVAREEISAFGPVPAVPEHELWLDDNGKFHYDLGHVARTNLASIFKVRCAKADSELKSGGFAAARIHAMVAYSANPHSVDPLVRRAAAEQRMIPDASNPGRIKVELALTEILAESHLSIPEFQKLYLDLVGTCVAVPQPAAFQSCSKLASIANKRPEPYRNASFNHCSP